MASPLVCILKGPGGRDGIMGFFNYFRDSIPNFAALAQPITDLTKKSKSNKICWGVGEQRALNDLKSALQEATENVTGWAVAQTCCISQCAKYRKSGIFGYRWEQNP